ncbi:Sensor histidine kinase RcsC [Caprobacter fermentans]|uniref:histidine kinase n=1 Tax=Caproicibacter fermentans TaxID=2576756 RepID=A0A6N8HYS0_9FIRM|nr:HAMP domain-containing sensor histidine kinase [Caproicibacter fermentans]MVB10991.1 Sensor histidine kinase RcsC [Caproicibacter fermentans]OCN01694.1 two-component sensor histidine kinase [Clostridium sp. W14A]QNK39394.1 HAMP domain-containing histidine kinase [Caproicibacter fermentans]
MQKTLFKKYLRITSLVIIVSFFLLSFVMLIAISGYWQSEKQDLLRKNAQSVARIAADSVITVNRNEYQVDGMRMQTFILAFADNIDSDIFVTKQNGQILLAAYGSGGNVDSTRKVSAAIMQKALNGGYTAQGTMDGFYDQRYYIVGEPIAVAVNGTPVQIGAVFAAYSVKTFNAFRLDIMKMIILAALAAFAVSFCVIWLFSFRLVQPLRNMAAAARCFGEGNFSVRVPVTSQDEIGQLSVAFNNMADSLASVEHVRRDFIANVSHELKTPMTTIAGFIDGILDGTIPAEKEGQYLGIVSQEVKRLSRLVRTMLDLSRIDSGELKLRPARFDLTGTVLSALLSFEKAIEDKKIEVRGLENAESLFVDGDPDMIHQVVYNLIDNAVKFTNEGGYLEIGIREEPDRTTVSVENSGDGISPDELPMVFERFYKTDKSRSQDKNGMGLGLYIVKTIIRLHGGEITARSVWHKNCRFEFWLPRHKEKIREERRLVETRGEEPKANPKKK